MPGVRPKKAKKKKKKIIFNRKYLILIHSLSIKLSQSILFVEQIKKCLRFPYVSVQLCVCMHMHTWILGIVCSYVFVGDFISEYSSTRPANDF